MPLDTHIDNVEILKHYIEVGEKESYVDFSIQGGFIKSNNIASVEELAKWVLKHLKCLRVSHTWHPMMFSLKCLS